MNNDLKGLRSDYNEYTVKKGESLYTIAKKFQTTVSELTDINMLTSATIYPGQILLVPKDVTPTNNDYYFEQYITKPGDTIEKIAVNVNVEPQLIGHYNDIGKLVLVDRQTIKIPRTESYVVKNNETVDSILARTNRTAEQILRANATRWLKPGTKIF